MARERDGQAAAGDDPELSLPSMRPAAAAAAVAAAVAAAAAPFMAPPRDAPREPLPLLPPGLGRRDGGPLLRVAAAAAAAAAADGGRSRPAVAPGEGRGRRVAGEAEVGDWLAAPAAGARGSVRGDSDADAASREDGKEARGEGRPLATAGGDGGRVATADGGDDGGSDGLDRDCESDGAGSSANRDVATGAGADADAAALTAAPAAADASGPPPPAAPAVAAAAAPLPAPGLPTGERPPVEAGRGGWVTAWMEACRAARAGDFITYREEARGQENPYSRRSAWGSWVTRERREGGGAAAKGQRR